MQHPLKHVLDRERLVAGGIFAFTLLVFLISRVHQVADSNYSMLLSQSLLHHQSFTLDAYKLPRFPPRQQTGYVSDGDIYQLELVNGHLYYFFPPGTSLLSLPYVAIMNLFGVSASNPDGTYNPRGEGILEGVLAALLMSGFTVVLFHTARLLLSLWSSVLVACAGALGTQVWSTASRALWSDSFGIFILGIVLFMIARAEIRKTRPAPIILATLLSWLYFVRPTFAIVLIAITIYVLVYHRQVFFPLAATGTFWALLLVGYSEYHFHNLLPSYFRAGRLSFATFWIALAGNLISPSRGLFIFVPVLLFVAYLLIRYRRRIKFSRLAVLSLAVIVVHVVIVSGFVPWWGGHSYGPRYTAGLVPWFCLLGILAMQARLAASEVAPPGSWRRLVESGAGIVLLSCSVAINGVGANSHRAWQWNVHPVNVDEQPGRIWDWRHPQFFG